LSRRHLAKVWSETPATPSAKTPRPIPPISQISTFVLLDLLGSPSPFIRNYYHNTGWLYDRFIDAEDRLGEAGLLWPSLSGDEWATTDFVRPAGGFHLASRSFFEKRLAASTFGGHIEDDHIPFLNAGVPVVHLIPIPFPDVWHTLKDDASALDYPTLRAWSKIMQLVTAEYLALSPAAAARKRDELVRAAETDSLDRLKLIPGLVTASANSITKHQE
jgi:glutaminyl-peptide cyclotransferase